MHQTFFTAADSHESTEVNDTDNFTVIDTADFHFCGDFFDTADSHLRFIAVSCSNLHSTVIFDFDSGAGFFGQGTDHRTAFTDNVFDFVRVDADGVNARCKFRDISTW